MNDKLREWEELTERLKNEDIGLILRKARKKGHICPVCDNGSGETGDGITKQPRSNPPLYKCFKCGFSGSLIDIVGAMEGITDFTEARNRAAELCGYALPGSDKAADPKYRENLQKKKEAAERKAKFEEAARKKQEEAERVDYTSYYKECAAHITDADYMQSRGISLETCKRFLVGYDAEWKHPKKHNPPTHRVIIPNSRYSYLARACGDAVEIEQIKSNEYDEEKSKVGTQQIFNIKALDKAELVFITEGEIDAMSICEAGQEAIAYGSTAYKDHVIKELERRKKAGEHIPLLAIIPDNDKNEAGQKAADFLINEAGKLGIKAYKAAELTGAYKDSNDYLKAEREAFIMAVNDKTKEILAENTAADQAATAADQITKAETAEAPKPETAEEREAREKQEADAFLHDANIKPLTAFLDIVGHGRSAREIIPTGFDRLDKTIGGGLTEGLYTIGAVSSLGKTSFCLQMADHIASSGTPVIYISLEMPADELIAKIVSRRLYESHKRNIAAGELLRGIKEADLPDAMEVLGEMGETPLYYFEGSGNIGAEVAGDIKQGVKEITQRVIESRRKAGQPDKTPVVIVDYLQILQAKDMRATDKANNDFNVVRLKTMAREMKCPIIAISSFNRNCYNRDADYEAFKETGAIEYTSDCVLALQFACMSKDASEVQKEIKKQIEKGKNGEAQQLQLKILKNRMGFKDAMDISFVPKYNYFTMGEFIPESKETKAPFSEHNKWANVPLR